MRGLRTIAWIAAILVAMTASRAAAQDAAAERPAHGELVVGTFSAPPFVMHAEDGSWTGLAIDLWREVARRQGITYRIEKHDLPSLVAGIESGHIDVGVGPLLITADRERRMDLTSPFMHIALGIGTRPETGWWPALSGILPREILWAMLGLAILLVVSAVIVWLLERHRNPQHFGGAGMRGLGDAIWWSASTMSTVGYGDRTPVTFWGRTTGIAWMFISIVLVSAFIALVSSTFTVHQLQSEIRSIADLSRVRVGAVEASGSAEYLRGLGIATTACAGVGACLDALVAGEVDAVVEEWPILNWEASHRYPGRLAVVPQPFTRGFIGFALPRDSPRRRPLSVTMLQVLDDPIWQDIARTYLGASNVELSRLVNARAP
jgi:polar amino acid transport system substrate-binding protein